MSDLRTRIALILRTQIKSRGWVTAETMADALIREMPEIFDSPYDPPATGVINLDKLRRGSQ